jgi:hypothetical protein
MSYLLKIRKSSFRSPDRLVDASGRRYRLVEASAWNDRSRFKMGMKKLVESDHTLKAFLVKIWKSSVFTAFFCSRSGKIVAKSETGCRPATSRTIISSESWCLRMRLCQYDTREPKIVNRASLPSNNNRMYNMYSSYIYCYYYSYCSIFKKSEYCCTKEVRCRFFIHIFTLIN